MKQAIKTGRKGNLTQGHWLLLGISLIVSGIVISAYTDEAAANRPDTIDAATVSNGSWNNALPWTLPPADSLATDAADDTTDALESEGQWQTIKVKYGDNLSAIFARSGISPQLLHNIISLGDDTKTLKSLRPGQIIKLKLAEQSQLLELMYDMDPTRTLRMPN